MYKKSQLNIVIIILALIYSTAAFSGHCVSDKSRNSQDFGGIVESIESNKNTELDVQRLVDIVTKSNADEIQALRNYIKGDRGILISLRP
ncbi:hypothetical protein CJF42_24705 [Pseudoalteromonas sp. NBT06-2]|uniref:hypothetical protein n=1 Tax=Pseudoalteromonas sp. NBT06-2 TaxID=2025950 RepID=UPI000BA71F3B|nr:hypothetical protein [Pseudoalteromonas sp. NBT06-2]PAJ71812.1 hypothetical protein CJF42_24705 [Pseudoalteromonas sp. NBT06-2]